MRFLDPLLASKVVGLLLLDRTDGDDGFKHLFSPYQFIGSAYDPSKWFHVVGQSNQHSDILVVAADKT